MGAALGADEDQLKALNCTFLFIASHLSLIAQSAQEIQQARYRQEWQTRTQ